MGSIDVNEDELVSLAHLIAAKKLEPGTLATAIENQGIEGWDRYNRFRQFKGPDDENVRKALDALAREAAFNSEISYGDHERSPANECYDDGEGIFWRYGWRQESMPDFAAIEAVDTGLPSRSPTNSTKANNASLAIIGALLRYIRGELGTAPHPDWRGQAQLILLLGQKLKFAGGISERNLEKQFADANRHLDWLEELYKQEPDDPPDSTRFKM